jgi:hypothetical protein
MHGWEGNIKMDLKEIKWEIVTWIYVAHVMDQWWVFLIQ